MVGLTCVYIKRALILAFFRREKGLICLLALWERIEVRGLWLDWHVRVPNAPSS